MTKENLFWDGFWSWEKSVHGDLSHIAEILTVPVSDEPEKLISDLSDAEAWYSRCGFILADANSWLDRAKYHFNPSRENRTEADRKVLLDKEIADVRKVRDQIEVLCDGLKQRIIMGESFLSYRKSLVSVPSPVGIAAGPIW